MKKNKLTVLSMNETRLPPNGSSARLMVFYSGYKKYKINRPSLFLNKRRLQQKAIVWQNTTEGSQLDNNYRKLRYLKHEKKIINQYVLQVSPGDIM